VLEDYHRLGPSKAIDQALSVLLEHLPPGIHFAISSRLPVTFPTGRLKALNQVNELTEDHLRFQDDEIDRLIGVGFSHGSPYQKLVELSEGWVTGLRLIRQAIQVNNESNESRMVEGQFGLFEQIYQYVADEIWSQQTAERRKFLLQSSILKTFTSEDCNFIFNRANSSRLLDYLERNRLFTFSLGGNPPVYRYHSLFSAFLENKRQVKVDALTIQAWHERASRHYLERQKWESAFEHALLAGIESLAVEVLSQSFTEMRLTGRLDQFQSWLDSFPQHSFQSHPMLFILQGMLWSDRGLFTQARGAFRQALEVSREVEHRAVIVKAWSGLGMVYQRTGDLKNAEDYFQKALEYIDPEQAQEWITLRNGLAQIYLYKGQNQRAQKMFRHCVEMAAQINNLAQAVVMNNLGSVLLTQGEFTEAQFWFENALKIRREANSLPGMAICLNNMAMVQTRIGRLSDARSNLEQARSLLDESQYPMYAAYIFSNYGDIALAEGDFKIAEHFFRKSIELKEAVNDPPGRVHTLSRLSELRRKQDNLADALYYAQQAVELSQQSTGLNEQMLAQTELGIVQLCRGEYSLAVEILSFVANTQGEITKNLYGSASGLWYLAAAKRALGYDFQEDLAESLGIISHRGYDTLLANLGFDHPELLLEALSLGEEPATINKVAILHGRRLAGKFIGFLKTEGCPVRLLAVDMLASIRSPLIWEPLMIAAAEDPDGRVRKKAQDAIDYLVNSPPPPLFVSTLGGFTLKRGEDCIPNSTWKNRKALELLKYLLTSEGKPVHRETLIELLWPAGQPDKASRLLNQALYRIRKNLEPYLPPRYSRYLIPEENAYRLVLPEGSSVDELELRATALAGSRAYQRGNRDEAEGCFTKVLELYRGDYLPEDSVVEWTISRRENIKSRVISAANLLAEIVIQKDQAERAVEIARRSLEIDPLQEAGYEWLVRAFLALGRPESVIKAYERYLSNFCAELEVPPSKVLEDLYRLSRE
jgi:ATP/maltotriose-dependent transcriptional regulator MalT/DNA-binding SARP family transcriptional activator